MTCAIHESETHDAYNDFEAPYVLQGVLTVFNMMRCTYGDIPGSIDPDFGWVDKYIDGSKLPTVTNTQYCV